MKTQWAEVRGTTQEINRQGDRNRWLASVSPWVVGFAAGVYRTAGLSRKGFAQARSHTGHDRRRLGMVELNNRVVMEAARELGVEATPLPGGFLELRRGKEQFFSRGGDFPFESVGAYLTCGDKFITSTVLRQHGLPVPEFASFDLSQYAEACDYFQSVAKPVVVKPTSGTAESTAVSMNVNTQLQFRRAFAKALAASGRVTVEEQMAGDLYRFSILDGRLLSVIHRLRAYVAGDGVKSIEALISEKNLTLLRGEQTCRMVTTISTGRDMQRILKARGYSMQSIPRESERVVLEDMPDSLGGGEFREVSDAHPDHVKTALSAARAMRAKLVGIDLFSSDITRPSSEVQAVVNEVNTTPALFGMFQPEGGEWTAKAAREVLEYLFDL